MAHAVCAETHAVHAPPITFFNCYGNDGDHDAPIAEPWVETPATPVTEEEMTLLWCHEDMDAPCGWTD